MTPIKSILVSTDFGAESELALHYAMLLADLLDAELHLLHVASSTLGTAPGLPSASGEVALIREAKERDARARMHQLLTPEEMDRFHVRVVVAEGLPAEEIVRYAQEANIDLIVMATHGRGLLGEILRGSVAHQVAKAAPCPVVLCPPHVRVPTPRAERAEELHEIAAPCEPSCAPTRQVRTGNQRNSNASSTLSPVESDVCTGWVTGLIQVSRDVEVA